MTIYKACAIFLLTIACTAAENRLDAQVSNTHNAAQVRTVFTHALPALDGRHLDAKIVEVVYAPGGSSLPHSHPCPVIGYVLEGAVRMQVKGEAEVIYRAGDSFYEAPNGVHQVSANASDREPAKFLAYFLCDHDTPLTVPAASSNTAGGK
jgi:quercetin dioxygenase-like cupin family protein